MHKKIVICGAGTVGGTLCEHLVRLGYTALSVIDDDKVEARNLANQPYQRRDVGQPKARALADLVHRTNGGQVTATVKRLTRHTAGPLLQGADVVVDAFDNHESRAVLADHCRAQGLHCLHAGLSRERYAEVIWNESYRVPVNVPGDPCMEPLTRTLSLMVVAVIGECLRAFLEKGTKRSFTVTLGDLAIREI